MFWQLPGIGVAKGIDRLASVGKQLRMAGDSSDLNSLRSVEVEHGEKRFCYLANCAAVAPRGWRGDLANGADPDDLSGLVLIARAWCHAESRRRNSILFR